jgi:hypothetical protein
MEQVCGVTLSHEGGGRAAKGRVAGAGALCACAAWVAAQIRKAAIGLFKMTDGRWWNSVVDHRRRTSVAQRVSSCGCG